MSNPPSLLRTHEANHILGRRSVKLDSVSRFVPHLILPGGVRYPAGYITALKMFSMVREGERVSSGFVTGYAGGNAAAVLTGDAIGLLDDELNRFTYGNTIHKLHVKAALNVGERTVKNWLREDIIQDAKDGPGTINRASLDEVLHWEIPEKMTGIEG